MTDQLIKTCGLSTPETVDAAVDAGATHIGLIHFEPSPRHLSLEDAAALRRRVPPPIKVVLLLVNMQAQPTVEAIDAVRPDVVQFHGTETAQWLQWLRDKSSLEIWKGRGIRDRTSLDNSQKFASAAHRLIYDSPAQALPGGNGVGFDWSVLDGFAHQTDWGLAGGLTPNNVADAIRATGAPLVDASTGLETAPGVKSVDLIRAFCEAARST